MGISEADYKLLWGRAAGRCSNPTCRADLTVMLAPTNGYNVGEMAHIIAQREGGPRGRPGGGGDAYGNLILLCPTCHRMIDKAPNGTFTEAQLLAWKSQHEHEVRRIGEALRFRDIEDLKRSVCRKLRENRRIFETYGPHSTAAAADPGSNLSVVWDLRKLSTLIPNNTAIVNEIGSNQHLLSEAQYEVFLAFKDHAQAFEKNQYHRLDSYPLFPKEFEREFGA
jgi:hypothetical protein